MLIVELSSVYARCTSEVAEARRQLAERESALADAVARLPVGSIVTVAIGLAVGSGCSIPMQRTSGTGGETRGL